MPTLARLQTFLPLVAGSRGLAAAVSLLSAAYLVFVAYLVVNPWRFEGLVDHWSRWVG